MWSEEEQWPAVGDRRQTQTVAISRAWQTAKSKDCDDAKKKTENINIKTNKEQSGISRKRGNYWKGGKREYDREETLENLS